MIATAIVAVAALAWWQQAQLRPLESEPSAARADSSLTPELFGVTSTLSPAGGGVLVDTPDSSGPLVLVVTTRRAIGEWAPLQALLERAGIGSVVVSPAGDGNAQLSREADAILERVARQGRPAALITVGEALDRALDVFGVGHRMRVRQLVAVDPAPWRGGWWERARRRLPFGLGGTPADTDPRLAAWSGDVLVVHAIDNAAFDSTAARRIADGRSGTTAIGRLPGGGYDRGPAHPADDDWRQVTEFLRGRPLARPVTLEPDTAVRP